jgi:hypothetical protein
MWIVLEQASTSTLMAGASERLFWLGKVATTLCTTEGFGKLAPSIFALMLCFALKLSLVPSKPLVAPPHYVPPLLKLCFPWNPQPWSLRKCARDFGLAAFLPFEYSLRMECPYVAQKVQFTYPGLQYSGLSVAVST